MKKRLLASIFLMSSFCTGALAQESYGIGVGLGYQQKPYAGDHSEWVPLPIFELQNGIFFVKGLKAGLYLFDSPSTKLDAHLRYQPLSFKPGSSHGALQGLDRRKSTIELGAGITHIFENQVFINAELDADIMDRSSGVNLDTNVGMIHHVNDHFRVIPKVGVNWSNKKHNDYYYGISRAEANRTGLSEYNSDSSFTPYIGVGTVIDATDNLHIFGGAKLEFLPNEVKNSPMTDRSTISNISIGVNYNF